MFKIGDRVRGTSRAVILSTYSDIMLDNREAANERESTFSKLVAKYEVPWTVVDKRTPSDLFIIERIINGILWRQRVHGDYLELVKEKKKSTVKRIVRL